MERIECDRMLIAVMETGSFAAAAQRLKVSPGQASKMITRLEHDLNVNLIRRSTRSLTLTEVGQAYYEQITQLIASYDALNDSVRNSSSTPSGTLRISAPVTFGTFQLPELLMKFSKRYPDIELDVRFSDRLVNLIDEGFDLSLRIGQLEDSSLIARKLCDIRIVLVASPAYVDAKGMPEQCEKLSMHDCVVDTNFREPYIWPFVRKDRKIVIQSVKGKMNFSNAEVCLKACIAGFGISRLPLFVVSDAIKTGKLITILSDYEAPPLGLYAVYPSAKYIANKSRVFIEFLANAFSEKPQWE
ncbi:LysR family transcriptional regulator [Pantoea dispersa]|uniref:LysR family transcriptional regulator n=1 Tax=Pantoea dispersa TaxID=59814 RepID=UPI0021AF1E75|nr:LysR family transcriptional regulator [Pantoea dispersa]MCT6592571.1 LysR family transcriptional regulator [Pantoea dispersa]MCW0323400.1 HTH-type transcriptional regulator DmlR [Pantoea dispersa]MCW0328136.1 HTH-type transcriptional regulator DmlR [Pantoea dispersa]MCW0434665.1 HTH-type transcriptional regulator DmlR [Pantoea dispersa]